MTAITQKPQTGAEAVRWDLSDLYQAPDDPQIEADIQTALNYADAFAERYHSQVASLDAPALAEAVAALEAIVGLLNKLGSYATLLWTTDTANPVLGKLLARVQELGNKVNQKVLFFELEWAAAPEEVAALADAPELERYRHYLNMERIAAPYRRAESEEQIMSQLGLTGSSGWGRFFGEYVSGLKYPWEGEMITQSEILAKVYHPDRDVRRMAAESVTGVLQDHTQTTGYIFNMILLDKASRDEIRGYESWITARNLSNQVADETVNALIEAVTSRYDIVQRYYAVLRDVLGVDELYDYDRYAPVSDVEKHVLWDEAHTMVLDAYGQFSGTMADIAGQFFTKGWIDAPPAPSKRGGAYSMSGPVAVHPYIFMNYEGKLNSVFTLAHELGHGIHQYLARDKGEFGADTPLTTAEMASTFGEMLTFDYLIAQENDPATRLSMRMERAASTFATVFRQVSMNRFEEAMHLTRRESGELSTEQFNTLWLETQRAMFGDSVTLRDDYGVWWSYIPHFIQSPGYVYAYAFGELLVWALYARYQSSGDKAAFAAAYEEVLRAGGSDYPYNILRPLAVDLQDPAFWHEGLNLISDFVSEIERDAAQR
ncbi:MAG: M3 family oligoendopeptidase [Anaerolineales bacterium]